MSLKTEIQGFDISGHSAAVIGCGGLGTNIAVHLAGAGIGKLLLIDYDRVEARNLNRQFLYTQADVGREKSRLLAERLRAYAPEVAIDSVCGPYEADLCAGYEIILIAVDNLETRSAVNRDCTLRGVPCVNGSINGFFGTAYLYLPGKTPDLAAAGCLDGAGFKNRSPSTTAALIGAQEAKLAIDFFLGSTQSAGILFIYDSNEIRTLKIRGNDLDKV